VGNGGSLVVVNAQQTVGHPDAAFGPAARAGGAADLRPEPTPVHAHGPAAADASGEFLDLVHQVLRSFRQGTAGFLDEAGTTPGQLRFLRTLARFDTPRRSGEIAECLCVAPRSVTSKVDAAEAAGHVRRIPDPTDRRATLIELTETGRDLLSAVATQRREGAQDRLARLSEPDRAELLRLLRHVAGD